MRSRPIVVVVRSSLSGKTVSIFWTGEAFELVDGEGCLIAHGASSRKLSDFALWECGARSVRHEYPLQLEA